MSIAFWLSGFVGLIIACVVASARARAMPSDVVARGAAFAAAITCAGLAVGAIWLWGGTMATSARADRLHDGAQVRLAIRSVTLSVADGSGGRLTVGHGEAATLQLPGAGAAVVATIESTGTATTDTTQVSPGTPTTYVMPAEIGAPLAQIAVARCKASDGDHRAYAMPAGASVIVIDCDGKRPASAITLHRDRTRAEITASVEGWRGHFQTPQLTVRAGDVLRIGNSDDAVPGVTGWDVPSAHGTSTIVVVPQDPTECASWAEPGASDAATPRAIPNGCEIGAGNFAISAIALVPDADGVVDRNTRAVIAIVTPIVMLLFALALAPPSVRRSRVVARALRLAVLGVGLAALVCWRLTWAHRIDMLRDLLPAGPRVADNVFAAIAIGAALAGLAVDTLDAVHSTKTWRRIATSLAAWGVGLAAGIIAAGFPAMSTMRPTVIAMSMAATILPILRGRPLAAEWKLAAIAIAAIAARAVASHFVFAKLGLAYAFVFAGHAALRTALASETRLVRRAAVLVALAIAGLALARFDAGVTLAIAGVGLAFAMLVAGHDTLYHATNANQLGVLEREHARLLAVHGVAASLIVIVAAVFAMFADDRELIESSTSATLYAPLIVAGLFAAAAAVARSHRRTWLPWLAAALAAFAMWGARDSMIEWATGGSGVASQRVSAVVEPGYAVLRDERKFAANASAWREASLPSADDNADRWSGQGYFAARVSDPGVLKSVGNDYFPVLVARDSGVSGLLHGVLLLLGLVVAAAASSGVRLRHASDEHRKRWLVASVVGALCVYQPLASLGVLPLTGISWPGMGIDSPSDLWLLVIGLAWVMMGADRDDATAKGIDERVRTAPRLRRARKLVIAGLALAGISALIIVGRVGAAALGRAGTSTASQAIHDTRVDAALSYASGLACPWPATEVRTGTLDELVPIAFGGKPSDAATMRFDREMRAAWLSQRAALVAALANPAACTGKLGASQLSSSKTGCSATFSIGWPELRLDVTKLDGAVDAADVVKSADAAMPGDTKVLARTDTKSRRKTGKPDAKPAKPDAKPAKTDVAKPTATDDAATDDDDPPSDPAPAATTAKPAALYRATCAVSLPGDTMAMLRERPPTTRIPRIRVVGEAMGIAAHDLGELVAGTSIIRLRPGAGEATLPTHGFVPASRVTIAPGTTLVIDNPAGGPARSNAGGSAANHVMLRGPAQLLVADGGAWRRVTRAADVPLDRMTLIVAGARIVMFRPPRAWAGDTGTSVDPLLADDISASGERTRRTYPYGSSIPELGWVNPYDVTHSLGLDGWVHAAQRSSASTSTPASCGTLAPPAAPRDRVCSPSPLDGVMECRVTVQPELALDLRALAHKIAVEPEPFTGKTVTPERVAYVVLRGDTGALLAQGDLVPGRPELAYAPSDAASELALIRLREDKDPVTGGPGVRGETDAERVDWNLPIAVGSTFKPIVARAAEEAFPQLVPAMALTSAGHAKGCRARRGNTVEPMLGHCPPTSLQGTPTSADLHEFLAHSPNWYQAALGLVGLGLPSGHFEAGGQAKTLADIAATDLAAWPVDQPLLVSDDQGPIVRESDVVIAGVRRAPMWNRLEALLGRPLCTLGDRKSCERAAERGDVCSARALPIDKPERDLRHLVSLGPSSFSFYGDDRPGQDKVAVREYFQLLRGSGVHSVGSLAQLVDAFGRVVYDPSPGAKKLAASWFPTPVTGTLPAWSCGASKGRDPTVLGADGGLCAVVGEGGTAHAPFAKLLGDPSQVVVYGAKTGTIDSLAEIARHTSSCEAWNRRHTDPSRPQDRAHQPSWLECGKTPPDDSLFVVAFGVVVPDGSKTGTKTIPITLGIQLQRGGKSAAARSAPHWITAIAGYLRGSNK